MTVKELMQELLNYDPQTNVSLNIDGEEVFSTKTVNGNVVLLGGTSEKK